MANYTILLQAAGSDRAENDRNCRPYAGDRRFCCGCN